jgi:hypothetical protein
MKRRYKLKGGKCMANVLYINKYTTQPKSCSLLDLIINPEIREQTCDYYDKNHVESKVEKEIFESWKNRRARKDDK